MTARSPPQGPNFRKRWLAQHDALLADLTRLPTVFDRTLAGLADCRGFLFNPNPGTARITHTDLRFEHCDLSEGTFWDCNLMQAVFIGCMLDACNFTEIRMWQPHFVDCQFSDCSFSGQMGVDAVYSGCAFRKCSFKGGRSRSIFGHNAHYTDCTFLACRLSAIDLKSLLFLDCRFESHFQGVHFLGTHATHHLTGCSAAVFERCDLGQSQFKNVRIDADCRIVHTILPQPMT